MPGPARSASFVWTLIASLLLHSARQQPALVSDLDECGKRALEVDGLECRRHLDPDPRSSLRHNRKAETGDEDAALEELLRELDRTGRLAHDDWDDRRLTRQWREPCLA